MPDEHGNQGEITVRLGNFTLRDGTENTAYIEGMEREGFYDIVMQVTAANFFTRPGQIHAYVRRLQSELRLKFGDDVTVQLTGVRPHGE